MKYIITGGGTGGHINPALAIASEIKRRHPDSDILYVGTKNGLESDLVPKYGLDFRTIRVKGMPRRLNKASFIALRELIYGLGDSKKIIEEFKPNVVIGTGGYVSGPIIYMAKRKKIPALIHEQNAFPGITNKILGKYVDKIAVTFEEAKKYFKNTDRIINTGNPIRKEILDVDKQSAYKKLGIKPEIPLILSLGGSGGQKKLNECYYNIIRNYTKDDEFQLIHVTGTKFYDDFIKAMKSDNIILSPNIRILPYLYDIPEALNIADLIVTSAGAITLAEISAVGIPSILIPKAYTAENHQEYNARAFEKNGASVVILEKDLSYETLRSTIYSLIENKEKLKKMSINSRKLGKIDASSIIVDEIDKLLKKK